MSAKQPCRFGPRCRYLATNQCKFGHEGDQKIDLNNSFVKPAFTKKIEQKSSCLVCSTYISLYSSHCEVCRPICDAIFARDAIETELDEKLFYPQYKLVVTYNVEDLTCKDEQGNIKEAKQVMKLPLLKIFKSSDINDDGHVTDGRGNIVIGEYFPWNDKLAYYKRTPDYKVKYSITSATVKKRAREIRLDDD